MRVRVRLTAGRMGTLCSAALSPVSMICSSFPVGESSASPALIAVSSQDVRR